VEFSNNLPFENSAPVARSSNQAGRKITAWPKNHAVIRFLRCNRQDYKSATSGTLPEADAEATFDHY